jgi:superfamily II DNA/RNA helicase
LFANELAKRAQIRINSEGEESEPDPLNDYLEAVAVCVDPGAHDWDEDENRTATLSKRGAGRQTFRILPTVRMVFGDTPRDIRQRLMLGFNSPLFPELLISSAVLGEGVDLHRFCRYVIHHDLCWNPSTLEQRTGRLDRIRCKAEWVGESIMVYEPFLAGSADEKMFRVVRDRERWFQIVMGQKFEFDERASEELAGRVPLPAQLAQDLIFNLARYRRQPDTLSPAPAGTPSC